MRRQAGVIDVLDLRVLLQEPGARMLAATAATPRMVRIRALLRAISSFSISS